MTSVRPDIVIVMTDEERATPPRTNPTTSAPGVTKHSPAEGGSMSTG